MDDREWLRHVTLAEAAPDYSTVTNWVRRQNGFSLKLLWLPECRLTTLKPMLKVAREATVFGYRKDGRYAHLCTDILIPDRGKFHLDLRKELFAGRDELWGCGFSGWSSLVVTVRNSESLLHPIISTGFGLAWRVRTGSLGEGSRRMPVHVTCRILSPRN